MAWLLGSETAMTLSEYLLSSTGFEPAYLKLYRTAELLQRTKQVLEELGHIISVYEITGTTG